ncbi:alpha-glucan family phosphorylase [Planctomycetota bacterium]
MARKKSQPSPDTIAYFSMEVGIDKDIPTYSGGLGILAGDTIRAAADLAVPYVAITLLTRKGYFRQHLQADGQQIAQEENWTVAKHLKPCKPRVILKLGKRRVILRAWRYDARGHGGAVVPVLYLDVDLPANHPADRVLCHHLYGGDAILRLQQEWILGTGGIKMLRALGYRQLKCYHMNEGHAAFLTFELLAEARKATKKVRLSATHLATVRQQCVFTTHTPVAAGHDAFDIKLARDIIGDHPAWTLQKRLGVKQGVLNMTYLALASSRYVNGVAQKHGEVSQTMFPDYTIDAITNGTHLPSWTSPPIQRLLDRYVPDWREDHERLRYALNIPCDSLWEAHQVNKTKLIKQINRSAITPFDPQAFTIGFARRATAYKRADLIFQRLNQLQNIAAKQGKIQFVFAGKAHPKDLDGQRLIRKVVETAQRLAPGIPIAYLPNYNIALAQVLIPGVDLWLNTPEPPMEASGTSGMKAVVNGIPNLSILDGWWIEGCVENLTGWAIGPLPTDKPKTQGYYATALIKKLAHVVDCYYQNRDHYQQVMRNTLALNGAYFNTQRMVKEYCLKAYRQ